MLKLSFWILLATNIVLFVFQQTYFDAPSPGKREPERLAYQYRDDQIRLLSAEEMKRDMAKAKIVAQQTAVSGNCIEVGPFNLADAQRFKKQIVSISLEKNDITSIPVYEEIAYMVFIPPSANAKAAQERIEELKKKGIKSYYLIKDQNKLKWAISLGVFKNRDSAGSYAEEIKKSGLNDIQIAPRYSNKVTKLTFQLYNLNEEQLRALSPIMTHFPEQSMQFCQNIPQNTE